MEFISEDLTSEKFIKDYEEMDELRKLTNIFELLSSIGIFHRFGLVLINI